MEIQRSGRIWQPLFVKMVEFIIVIARQESLFVVSQLSLNNDTLLVASRDYLPVRGDSLEAHGRCKQHYLKLEKGR